MIKSYKISSDVKWPKLLVLWAVHWNEKCWTIAINKIIDEINNWDLIIKTGSITFIPICNPKAYDMDVRYVEKNLNRVIVKHNNPKLYENKLANSLIKYIEKSDYILDIHSIKSNWVAFVFQDYENEEDDLFSKNIWINNIVKGRPSLYVQDDNSDTIWYAHKLWKIWVVVECGSHEDPISADIAYRAIINSLAWLWMIEKKVSKIDKYKIVNVLKFIDKRINGDFVKNWGHMDEVYAWELIAIYGDGDKLYSDINWYILLPNKDAKIWEERFYLGQ